MSQADAKLFGQQPAAKKIYFFCIFKRKMAFIPFSEKKCPKSFLNINYCVK